MIPPPPKLTRTDTLFPYTTLVLSEVDTIENRKAMLEELMPEARIAVAHGQLHERDLEKIMRDFVAQRYNILLCTTIIETGIDVPTANTIIMHRRSEEHKYALKSLMRTSYDVICMKNKKKKTN